MGRFPGFDGCQDFLGVAFRFDFGEDLEQRLVGTNKKSSALDAHNLLAVHVLFLEHPKLIAHDFVYICEEWIRQVELLAEFALGLRGVARNAQDNGAGLLEFLEGVAKSAGLDGTARGVCLGVKEEYHWLAGEVGEMDGVILIVLEGEVGNFFVQFHKRFLV